MADTNLRSWELIKDQPHVDGIPNPERFKYVNRDGVYYPVLWDVNSPDGLSIGFEFFASEEEAKQALTDWCKRYELQGYYSSPTHGRISIPDIPNYCKIFNLDEVN